MRMFLATFVGGADPQLHSNGLPAGPSSLAARSLLAPPPGLAPALAPRDSRSDINPILGPVKGALGPISRGGGWGT
jgi:hypothetical protein